MQAKLAIYVLRKHTATKLVIFFHLDAINLLEKKNKNLNG